MPDWNPDKEGHVGHQWIVQKAWPGGEVLGMDDGRQMFIPRLNQPVDTSKGGLVPNKEGRFTTSDEALAAEIRSEYPTEYTVTRVRKEDPADRGHRYHFGQWPEMPWKKDKKDISTKRPEKEAQDGETKNTAA